jgi:hypothetical protein
MPHIFSSDDAIIIQIRTSMPVLQASICSFVFLAENEVYKVLVSHLSGSLAREAPGGLLKDPVDDTVRESMLAISQQIISVDHEIVILIQLPKLHSPKTEGDAVVK